MNIFLTRALFNTPLLKERLKDAGINLIVPDTDDICPESEILNQLNSNNIDAMITHTEDCIDAELISKMPDSLKLIANYGIGFSNIDIDAATSQNIQVTNTPTEEAFYATAEATVALLITVARQIPALNTERRAMKTDPQPSFQRPTAVSIRNKVTGVIGLGRIGSQVAKMMHNGFNNDIIYFDLFQNNKVEAELNAVKVGLETLMKDADFICVNMPLSDKTYNLVSPQMLSLLKPEAVLVNTARAGLVNEDALIQKLNAGELHGAGLDVYSDKVNKIDAENVALTSHFANFEKEAYTAMTQLVADNVISYLTSNTPVTPVNSVKGE